MPSSTVRLHPTCRHERSRCFTSTGAIWGRWSTTKASVAAIEYLRSGKQGRRVNDRRPNPDDLLARVQAEEARAHRGKLKLFFGYAAGVGKTYAMLEAARREQAEGVDVVVGYVEPHGRAETEALLQGLDAI